MPFWSLKKRKAERKRIASANKTDKKILVSSDHTQFKLNTTTTDALDHTLSTQLTLSTTATDTLKEFDEIEEHQDTTLLQKEDKRIRLRQEINECQEQLSILQNKAKQLKVDTEETPLTLSSYFDQCKEEEEDEEWSQQCDEPSISSRSEDDEESSLDSDERHEEDETIATFYAHDAGSHRSLQERSRNSRNSTRKNSIRSRPSVRHDSNYSLGISVHSRSRYSVRCDSIHSPRFIREAMDDDTSAVLKKSLGSVSLSIKSLPRDVKLSRDEEGDFQGKDKYSCFRESSGKPDRDTRSVASRSTHPLASRRAMVYGGRLQDRKSRRPVHGQRKLTGTTVDSTSGRVRNASGRSNSTHRRIRYRTQNDQRR